MFLCEDDDLCGSSQSGEVGDDEDKNCCLVSRFRCASRCTTLLYVLRTHNTTAFTPMDCSDVLLAVYELYT